MAEVGATVEVVEVVEVVVDSRAFSSVFEMVEQSWSNCLKLKSLKCHCFDETGSQLHPHLLHPLHHLRLHLQRHQDFQWW